MHLEVMGFFKDPHPDETLKYRQRVSAVLEQQVLELLGWSSLDDGAPGLYELSQSEAQSLAGLLEDDHIQELSLFICTRA